MRPTLLLLHGRSQEFQDPATIRREWNAALNAGLIKCGLPLVTDTDSVLPYYANTLYRVTADLARSGEAIHLEALPLDPDQPGPLHPEMPQDVDSLEKALITDMAAQAGRATPEGLEDFLTWGPARSALRWLADHTRLDQQIISSYLKDVAVYLKRAREEVLAVVRKDLPDDRPLVIVSHSLGTVVARDLLDDDQVRDMTLLWATLGSPLAVDAVQKNLLTPGAHHPGTPWLNAYDERDIVALGNPFRPIWGEPLTDLEVQNGTEPHSITRYLSQPDVAREIGLQFSGR